MKKENGVTLVALVVTIIVLIILAGISINLVLGDNGIITIAKKAKENTELAKVQEETELNELYTQLETNESNSDNTSYDAIAKLTEFKRKIATAITNEKVETAQDASIDTMVANISKILQARTADATATANDISNGKTAYVNGELITGNGADNTASSNCSYRVYYSLQLGGPFNGSPFYSTGYFDIIDGVASKTDIGLYKVLTPNAGGQQGFGTHFIITKIEKLSD